MKDQTAQMVHRWADLQAISARCQPRIKGTTGIEPSTSGLGTRAAEMTADDNSRDSAANRRLFRCSRTPRSGSKCGRHGRTEPPASAATISEGSDHK